MVVTEAPSAAWLEQWDKDRAELESVLPSERDIARHASEYQCWSDGWWEKDWHGDDAPLDDQYVWDAEATEAAMAAEIDPYNEDGFDDEIW